MSTHRVVRGTGRLTALIVAICTVLGVLLFSTWQASAARLQITATPTPTKTVQGFTREGTFTPTPTPTYTATPAPDSPTQTTVSVQNTSMIDASSTVVVEPTETPWLMPIVSESAFYLSTFGRPPTSTPTPTVTQARPTATTAQTQKDTTELAVPRRVRIPRLGLDSHVEHLGLTAAGAMAAPGWHNLGWFYPGVRPGAPGNAVIAGHLDTDHGTIGPFWELHKLQPGDMIYVIDNLGQTLEFRVTHNQVYDYENPPMHEIFGSHEKQRLNLITCDGSWLRDRRSYSHRLVVFSELVNP